MNVSLMSIRGIENAIISLMMSKRTYTESKGKYIQYLVSHFTRSNGLLNTEIFNSKDYQQEKTEYIDWLNKLLKYGIIHEHETLLRFIDLTFTIEGLHYGGLADLDSHSMRMNNRIVRSSTRLAEYNGTEKSEWYKDKILNPTEYLQAEGLIPPVLKYKGEEYILRPFGYVKAGYEEDKDVLRGNYPLSVDSNCIFSINFIDFRHIYKVRGKHSKAHPELKDAVERMVGHLKRELPILGEIVDKEYSNGRKPHFVTFGNTIKVDALYYTMLESNKCKEEKEAAYLID